MSNRLSFCIASSVISFLITALPSTAQTAVPYSFGSQPEHRSIFHKVGSALRHVGQGISEPFKGNKESAEPEQATKDADEDDADAMETSEAEPEQPALRPPIPTKATRPARSQGLKATQNNNRVMSLHRSTAVQPRSTAQNYSRAIAANHSVPAKPVLNSAHAHQQRKVLPASVSAPPAKARPIYDVVFGGNAR